MWRSHVLVGLDGLWLLAAVPGALARPDAGLLAACAALGALLPDLDAGRSRLAVAEVAGVRPLLPLSAALRDVLGHRGLLHSLPGWLAFGAACLGLGLWGGGHGWPWPAPLALWLGYGSHLAADACTKSGVPAWPNSRSRRWHLLPKRLRLTTGSDAEGALLPLLALPAFALLLRFLA